MLTGVVSVAPSANAQQRNLVVFGDSIIADTTPEYLVNRIGSASSNSSLAGSPTAKASSGARPRRTTTASAPPESWACRLGLPCAGTTAISQAAVLRSTAPSATAR